jgi:uncharacterized protein
MSNDSVLRHSNWPCRAPGYSNYGGPNGVVETLATTQAVILGLGSLFNHSTNNQNVGWTRDVKNSLVTYTTLRDIRSGEELCISYGDRLTFVDADARVLHDTPEEAEDVLASIQLV